MTNHNIYALVKAKKNLRDLINMSIEELEEITEGKNASKLIYDFFHCPFKDI